MNYDADSIHARIQRAENQLDAITKQAALHTSANNMLETRVYDIVVDINQKFDDATATISAENKKTLSLLKHVKFALITLCLLEVIRIIFLS